jgi:hypothetical protein
VALDPVITERTETGFFTLVVRIIRDLQGNEIDRDEFRTFYLNGVPLTEEEAEQQEESPSPTPSPTKT